MLTLESARPCLALQPYVRAYAQRATSLKEKCIIEAVPARLEQGLEFQFSEPYDVCFLEGPRLTTPQVAIVGSQTHLRANIELRGQTESLAVFFQPAGLSQLFKLPVHLFANQAFDASLVLGAQMRALRNRMGEARSFLERVAIVERFLLRLAASTEAADSTAAIAIHIFVSRGAVSVADLARQSGVSRRHFDRRFSAYIGLHPKRYSRVARFQTALDSKVADSRLSWLRIAHDLGYSDQMHMVHDFQKLGGFSPERLLALVGTQRPPALASSNGLFERELRSS